MTDHDALLRAVCAHPDDDTPRLVFADYLEDTGDADRAAFVRAQVEAARVPDWEPFPVFCRHRRPDWFTGRPWKATLPEGHGWQVAWVDPPFRRGFGYRVRIKSLPAWEAVEPRLLDRVPVGEFHLGAAATLDDWRAFARGPWAPRMRCVHLEANPREPLRALWESPLTGGITDIHMQRATSPGVNEFVMDLLNSPLGRGVRGLHFHMGYEALEELVEVLTPGDWAAFERLSLATMGLTPELVRRWCERGGPRTLRALDLRGNDALTPGGLGLWALARGLSQTSLTTLGLADLKLTADGLEALAGCGALASVRRLDLGRNPLTPKAVLVLARAWPFAGLRSLNLARCRIGDKGLRHLTRARFWPNLVELDLRENTVSTQGVRHLLLAEVPKDLTALLLDGAELGVDSRAALRQKFGDAVAFDAPG